MKKEILLIIVFLLSITIWKIDAKNFSITINSGIRSVKGVQDQSGKNIYTDIYGATNQVFGVDLGYKIAKSIDITLHSEYFSAEGELTYTAEKTNLILIPFEIGIRYFVFKKKILPYLGLGTGYYMYKETNTIDIIKESKTGFFSEVGLQLKLSKSFFTDIKVKYTLLKVDGYEEKIDLGGLSLTGGLGYTF